MPQPTSLFSRAGYCYVFLLSGLLTGHMVYATPVRIVSLQPSITELWVAAGAGSDIVGVTTHSNYLA